MNKSSVNFVVSGAITALVLIGGLTPAHADWVLVSSTNAILNPGAVTASVPGGVTASYAPINSAASVVYEWQSANGEVPADHAYINHVLQVEGDLTTAVSATPRNYGDAFATSIINGLRERDYKTTNSTTGVVRWVPAILINERTQTAARYFSGDRTDVTQISADFAGDASNQARAYTFYDEANGYEGSASATASRSASTLSFNVTE